jgi:hypothetical protein
MARSELNPDVKINLRAASRGRGRVKQRPRKREPRAQMFARREKKSESRAPLRE